MIILRISPRGLQFSIWEMPNNQCKIRLIGTDKSIIVDMSLEQLSAAWYKWQMTSKHIQEAFASMNPSHREFLITGITPAEWDKIFNTGDDRGVEP